MLLNDLGATDVHGMELGAWNEPIVLVIYACNAVDYRGIVSLLLLHLDSSFISS